MDLLRHVRIACRKLVAAGDDARAALLDEYDFLVSLTERAGEFPKRLQPEVRALKRELEDIRPVFPSQRHTSVLYDQEGLGETGRRRAKSIALRFVLLMKDLQRLVDQ